ncbi:hypothetical protein MACJ_000241 [Theileria orientalis]|uniref:Uncharacterized protein n=1 Tax=Theileria orientalis TaxID=68886 RepID=A0A976M3R7_THEOR|nr:hypothetical protein MACJ_000241 [Theileria orientalis]
MDDPKHRTLESKHDLLKDAFKKLYWDYEALKTDLSSKIEEYAKLHEENTHLKQSYDLLANEISQQNQKNVKYGPSSWTNPLTLIKGSQSNESETYQKLTEEIAQLKLKLENSLKENEELSVKNVQTTRDLEDNKAKHNVIVTELKDRLIALESILKDLQDQLNNNENKLSQYANEIKLLNTEIDNKSSEINTLNKGVESLKKEHSKDLIEWKVKLNEKFKFDLRRNSFINLNNVYQNGGDALNLDVHYSLSNYELFNLLVSSFGSFFSCWKLAFKFIQCSLISNDVTSNSVNGSHELNDTESTNSSSGFNNFDVSDETDIRYSTVFNNVDLRALNNVDKLVNNIENLLVMVCADFEKIMSRGKTFDSEQFNNISSAVKHLNEFFKLQRIYFCVEEYVLPYGTSTKDNRHSTKYLINLFGDIKKIILRFYCNVKSALYLINDKKRNQSKLLYTVLTNECGNSGESSSESSESFCVRSQSSLDSSLQSSTYADSYRNTSTKSIELQHRNLHYLIKSLFANVNDLKTTLNELKESLSHRLCYPKVYNGFFLPFTGGTNQMVQLTSSLSKLESDLTNMTEMRIRSYLNYMYTSLKFYSDSNHFNFKNYKVKTHNTTEYINRCNQLLSGSNPRIKLANLQKDLHLARRNENELAELKLKFANMQELLEIATYTSKKYEDELERLKRTNELEAICERIFNKLQLKFANANVNNNSYANTNKLESYKKIRKLNAHVKYLLKTITALEDSNKQLKLALQLNRKQYLAVKENEDSIHRNYNEQLVLMSEHISELNNAILNSEYKIAELTQTKVSCPSCGFNNTLGSMMGVDDKGRCSSCRCIVIFSSD